MTEIKLKASEAQQILDDGDYIEAVDEAIQNAINGMEAGGANVTLTLVIENDLEPEEDEEEESKDSE